MINSVNTYFIFLADDISQIFCRKKNYVLFLVFKYSSSQYIFKSSITIKRKNKLLRQKCIEDNKKCFR